MSPGSVWVVKNHLFGLWLTEKELNAFDVCVFFTFPVDMSSYGYVNIFGPMPVSWAHCGCWIAKTEIGPDCEFRVGTVLEDRTCTMSKTAFISTSSMLVCWLLSAVGPLFLSSPYWFSHTCKFLPARHRVSQQFRLCIPKLLRLAFLWPQTARLLRHFLI